MRPAIDSLESVVDRVVRMPLRVLQDENVHYRPLPFFHTPKVHTPGSSFFGVK